MQSSGAENNQSKRKSSFSKYFDNNAPSEAPLSPKPILKKKTDARPASLGRDQDSGVETAQNKRISWGKSKVLEFFKEKRE